MCKNKYQLILIVVSPLCRVLVSQEIPYHHVSCRTSVSAS